MICFKTFIFFVIFSIVLTQRNEPSSRIFKEKVRTEERTENTSLPIGTHQVINKIQDHVIGSMDTLASLARVQKDQAESFQAWANQFHIFKNNVWKFMNETSDVLRKNDKKIKTLQRVVRKIARDIDE